MAEPLDSPVRLVDCDVHPMIASGGELLGRVSARTRRHLQRYGTRLPLVTELYPRASNAGMRADSWPEGGLPGSDLDLMRSQLLDEHDIDYAVVSFFNPVDQEMPELAEDVSRAVNDWMWESWLEPEPRLLGSIVVPLEYPEAAVREIERLAGGPQWVQVLVPTTGVDPLGSRKYWPIYEAAAAHGLPVATHTGAHQPHLGTGWPSFYIEEYVGLAMVARGVLLSLICEGVFEKIPAVRFVVVEGGVAWASSLRWALDGAWELHRDDVAPLERKPSEYMREHVWFTTQPIEEPDDPNHFVEVLEHGELLDRLLFSTDYPHWDFDSPQQALPRVLSPDVRRRILAGTACELYGLPLEDRG
jgi:uncharacterized protein